MARQNAGNQEERPGQKEEKKEEEKPELPDIQTVKEVLSQVKFENNASLETSDDEKEDLKKQWMIKFLEMKGFQYSYNLFMEFQNKTGKQLNMFEKNFLGFILKILRVFITAAFIAIEPSVANIIELSRKKSEYEDEKELDDKKQESEYYGASKDNFDDEMDDMMETGSGIVINLD